MTIETEGEEPNKVTVGARGYEVTLDGEDLTPQQTQSLADAVVSGQGGGLTVPAEAPPATEQQ